MKMKLFGLTETKLFHFHRIFKNGTGRGVQANPLWIPTDIKYSKCSKILNTFLFLFSNKMLVIRAGINNTLVRIANWKDPDL